MTGCGDHRPGSRRANDAGAQMVPIGNPVARFSRTHLGNHIGSAPFTNPISGRPRYRARRGSRVFSSGDGPLAADGGELAAQRLPKGVGI